ncbi:unnamed protein product [Leptosia nina]|uniref:Glucosylceramidase n=1 Tax=Leptosia nina TaxID=320188 RepID=A0AAV1J0G9_9NEOP
MLLKVTAELSSDKVERRVTNSETCCPCPDTTARDSEHGASEIFHVFDDCPCRARSDSDGAASSLSPAVNAPQRHSQQKSAGPKPLLDPEVGLASSVLETLKEATEEGYQEALARDAARNAIQGDLNDLVDALNTHEDPLPEASNRYSSSVLAPYREDALSDLAFRNNLDHMLQKTPLDLFVSPKSSEFFSEKSAENIDKSETTRTNEKSIARNILTTRDGAHEESRNSLKVSHNPENWDCHRNKAPTLRNSLLPQENYDDLKLNQNNNVSSLKNIMHTLDDLRTAKSTTHENLVKPDSIVSPSNNDINSRPFTRSNNPISKNIEMNELQSMSNQLLFKDKGGDSHSFKANEYDTTDSGKLNNHHEIIAKDEPNAANSPLREVHRDDGFISNESDKCVLFDGFDNFKTPNDRNSEMKMSASEPLNTRSRTVTGFKNNYNSPVAKGKQHFKNFEDVNLDIYDYQPLLNGQDNTKSADTLLPHLNIKSYKTKLPIPKSLDLKPVKLQKAVRRGNDILGAVLTLDPHNKLFDNKIKSTDYRSGHNIFGNPLSSLPSINDIRSFIENNAKHILKPSRLFNRGNSNYNSPLPFNIGDAAENIRSYTEDAVKNVRDSIGNTFKNQDSTIGNALNSNGLIDTMSKTSFDLNDKLHLWRSNLNNRLQSLRQNVFDQSRSPSLQQHDIRYYPNTKDVQSSRMQPKVLGSQNLSKTLAMPNLRSSDRQQTTSSRIAMKSPTNTINTNSEGLGRVPSILNSRPSIIGQKSQAKENKIFSSERNSLSPLVHQRISPALPTRSALRNHLNREQNTQPSEVVYTRSPDPKNSAKSISNKDEKFPNTRNILDKSTLPNIVDNNFLSKVKEAIGNKPCAVRKIDGQSVVCVCNATYCDEVRRIPPKPGTYMRYESNEAGARFETSDGVLQNFTSALTFEVMLELDPTKQFNKIKGFGGAVTDSAAINWKKMSPKLQKKLIDSYFSRRGIEYNFLRVPIGGCDFSTRKYAYNELPENDIRLSNFSLVEEDLEYKIPMIKAAFAASVNPINIIASPWSPPEWMKEAFGINKCGRLKKEYYQTYADYIYKFIEEYNDEGVPIWGLTPVNEPANGIAPETIINCMTWTVDNLGKFVKEHLGPTIRSSNFSDVKILACDDQRPFMPYWVNGMFNIHPETQDFVDGLAVHYYFDNNFNTIILDEINKLYPSKFIINTEASEGISGNKKIILGSWDRAEHYVKDIIQDLNYNLVGWLDWNLCLDMKGGPTWCNDELDSAIHIDVEKEEFIKQPIFYALGHFSKFIPPGSRRLQINSTGNKHVSNVAFVTPQHTAVVVLYNEGDPVLVSIKLHDKQAVTVLEKRSVVTIEIAPEE